MIWCYILLHILTFQDINSNKNETLLEFDIVLKNKIVGDLRVIQSFKDSEIHYQSTSNITTKFIKEIHVNYKYDVIFNGNDLKKANVKITVNNKPHAETKTEWLDNHYQIKKDKKKERSFNETINYSTILMYFIEPENISSCFSEQDGSINKIEPLGNHSYKKINSKGKENIYYYKNGKLIKAEIDGGVIHFQMIAK